MNLLFYKSTLCPRCHIAQKYLQEATQHCPELKIETVDIVTSAQRFRRDGIRMIPTIAIEGKRLSMLWPTKKAIYNFLHENGVI